MKKTLRFTIVLAALAVATTASAQQRSKFGFGVSINPDDRMPVEVYAPIQVAPMFRIEPSLGIYTEDYTGGAESSNLTIGLGGFFVKKVAAPADLYAGARLKLNRASVDNGTNSESGTDFILAGALGGEYYLGTQFSVGLEANLGLYENGDVTAATEAESGFFTSGLGFLRFYF